MDRWFCRIIAKPLLHAPTPHRFDELREYCPEKNYHNSEDIELSIDNSVGCGLTAALREEATNHVDHKYNF
jgi:hypothetical protein